MLPGGENKAFCTHCITEGESTGIERKSKVNGGHLASVEPASLVIALAQ